MVLSSTEVLIQWDNVPKCHRNGRITHYEVMYAPHTHFGGQISAETVAVVNMTTVLVGLEEYVIYNISVRAINSAGAGPYSDIVQALTLQGSKYSNASLLLAFWIPYNPNESKEVRTNALRDLSFCCRTIITTCQCFSICYLIFIY